MNRKKLCKAVLAGILCLGLAVSGMLPGAVLTSAAAENSQTVSARMPFRDMTAEEIVSEMGTGWNLGNTMDGHTGFTPGETVWQNVETTQELIKAVHDMGFNTVRVPVTWGTMIDDKNGYAIDEKWMSRVQDIVDYAVNMNMYVIINIHHDGAEQTGWLRVGASDPAPVKEKFEAVWRHIAERFKDYDEHLIFESMNEVTGEGSRLAEDTAVINELNQIFVDTVRGTGSNNAYRWLSVPGRYTNIQNTTNPEVGFALPKDTAENRLFVSVHYYDWHFGLLETTQTTSYSYDSAKALQSDFKKLQESFTSKGIPVILGEYGAVNKNNTAERAYHMEIVNRLCQQTGVVPCYWDQGWYDLGMTPDYSFALVDRTTGEQIYPEIIAAIMRGMYLPGKEDLSDIVLNPEIHTQNIPPQGDTIYYSAGKIGTAARLGISAVDKSASNMVIVWKSSDETVAAVNAVADDEIWSAAIHYTGIGNAVISACTLDGTVIREIPVKVEADYQAAYDNPVTDITAEQDSYVMTEGQSLYLNAAIAPEASTAFLTYRSSDTEILTVSKIGKVTAKKSGSAYVIITASDGFSKVVPVTVEQGEAVAQISLALNIYYNDSGNNFFSNVTGEAISVREDGQYTLSFDCARDLPAEAVQAGVKGLSNMTAVYIKDDSVTRGKSKKSPLVSCDILYDSIVVDGQEFKVLMTEPKSALKSSGIFDTNDPLNSWDGSVIEEVNVSNHVLNFAGIENPQHIEVTFTLSNLVFEEGAAQAGQPVTAESLEADGNTSVTQSGREPVELTVKLNPAGAGKVTFVSSDSKVLVVDNTGILPEGGTVTVPVECRLGGTAEVTAYTDNGISTVFTVTSSGITLEEALNTQSALSGEDGAENGQGKETADKGSAGKENADGKVSEKEAAGTAKAGNNGVVRTVFLIVGGIFLAVAAFFIAMKAAGGNGKEDKKK